MGRRTIFLKQLLNTSKKKKIMSNNVIIFGAKKFGAVSTPVSTVKYPETAVITVDENN